MMGGLVNTLGVIVGVIFEEAVVLSVQEKEYEVVVKLSMAINFHFLCFKKPSTSTHFYVCNYEIAL